MNPADPDYPEFAVIVAPMGHGKTSDMINTCAIERTLWAGPVGAFKVAATMWGQEIPADRRLPTGRDGIETLDDLLDVLDALDVGDVEWIALDDMSVLVDATAGAMRRDTAHYPTDPNTGEFKGSAAFRFWEDLKGKIRDFRDMSRSLGVHVVTTWHYSPPETKKDQQTGAMVRHKGGAELPSRKTVNIVPYLADDVLIGQVRGGTYRPVHDWRVEYIADPSDPDLVSKTRLVRSGRYPANLRALMEESPLGYKLARSRGLEWQSEVAQHVRDRIVSGEKPEKVWAAMCKELAALPPLHVYAALRDGVDRAEIARRQRAAILGGN